MKQYHKFLKHILKYGVDRQDRTGTGTKSVFGYQMRFDLQKGFPLMTTKKIHWKSVVHEILWFLKGDTNIKYLNDNGVHIWDSWADKNGDLGEVYGRQWRSWSEHSEYPELDQIGILISNLISDPYSRRHIVSAWNVPRLSFMALPPCHCLFQFYVQGQKLSCQLYQRSADAFLGVPFNIASYSLLVHMIARVTNLIPHEFIWTGGDCHIYLNHLDQVQEQLTRNIRKLPTLRLLQASSIDGFKYDDIELLNYNPHPAIKAPIAV